MENKNAERCNALGGFLIWLALVGLGVAVWHTLRADIKTLADTVEQQGYANDRWEDDARALELQLQNICVQYPAHASCVWFTEDFKQRG